MNRKGHRNVLSHREIKGFARKLRMAISQSIFWVCKATVLKSADVAGTDCVIMKSFKHAKCSRLENLVLC